VNNPELVCLNTGIFCMVSNPFMPRIAKFTVKTTEEFCINPGIDFLSLIPTVTCVLNLASRGFTIVEFWDFLAQTLHRS